ncbi:hypothetical protein [Aeromonas sp. 95A]|uniref:hypothetical protein n=1 Tax=Aeromonas sp. 95A TaxID=3452729 RepID=UPI003F7AA0C6
MKPKLQKEIIAVFLSYYQDYFESALDEFLAVLKNSGMRYKCIVVFNGQFDKNNAINKKKYENIYFSTGDNTRGEFSGWQKGLSYWLDILADMNDLADNENYFIFANDTFNQHRKWNIRSRIAILSGIAEIQRHKTIPVLIGHADGHLKGLFMQDVHLHAWISTFIFVCNQKFLDKIKWNLVIPSEDINSIIKQVDYSGILWTASVNEAFSHHINKWLFPKDGQKGWYGANSKSLESKKFKLIAILNEKWLSKELIKSQGKLISWASRRDFILLFLKNLIRVVKGIVKANLTAKLKLSLNNDS